MEQNAFEISASDSKHKHRKNISITTNKQTNKAHATKLTFDVQNVILQTISLQQEKYLL